MTQHNTDMQKQDDSRRLKRVNQFSKQFPEVPPQHDIAQRLQRVNQFNKQYPMIHQQPAAPIPAYRSDAIPPARGMIQVD